MFLCKPCHEAGGCKWGFAELGSRGRCECCGESAGCRDCHGYDYCHGYDFRRSPDHTHPAPPTQDDT
jgi:hypothetical protein